MTGSQERSCIKNEEDKKSAVFVLIIFVGASNAFDVKLRGVSWPEIQSNF